MQNSKYSKVLTIVLIVVVILIIGLLIFWGVSALNKNKVETDAEDAISAFKNQVSTTNTTNTTTNTTGNVAIVDAYANMVFNEEDVTNGTGTDGKQKYKEFTMLGYIEIPKTNVKYPVLEETSKKALETSVAVLYGPGLNKEGNTVIVGHNYRNGTFFSNNNKLSIGDKIYITDETGQTLTYTIYKKYQTTPEDADYATRAIDAGVKEITLSTCTDDSGARIVIWAKAE